MKKYNLTAIMKRAWEVKREDKENVFGLCLKMAWEEAKQESDKMSWERIENILDAYCNKERYNGWYMSWTCNNWVKNGMDRTYITINEYRNGKKRCERKCGYWDNVANEYVAFDRYSKVTDITTLVA